VVDKLKAELMGAVEAVHNHDDDPAQLQPEHIRHTCNIGVFSILVELNTESPSSVLG